MLSFKVLQALLGSLHGIARIEQIVPHVYAYSTARWMFWVIQPESRELNTLTFYKEALYL